MKFNPPLVLQEIAEFLDTDFDGDPGFVVSGINEIHMVEAGDVTFVDHPKYYQKALHSRATTIIINDRNVEKPASKALLFSNDPFSDYVKLVQKYNGFTPATLAINESASIGEGTVIQPTAFIGNNVVIGKNCIIHSNVSIYDGCVLGDNVIVHANTVLGADAYYFQKRDGKYRKLESCGKVVIGNDVELGALCSIDRGVSGDTTIDEGTKMDNHVQVGHDTYIGKNCLIGAHTAIAGVTQIEDDVVIWGRCVVDKDLVIGKGAVILATSGVNKSIEGGKTYFGSPVDDVRKKWREIAAVRLLPDIINKIR